MAKQSPAQKETVERVMHEFKHGELRIGERGPKVKDAKQAIAIALRESGSSDRESPAANRRNLRHTKAAERSGRTGRDEAEGRSGPRAGKAGATRAELYDEAKKQDVPGRSKMSKAELERAVHR